MGEERAHLADLPERERELRLRDYCFRAGGGDSGEREREREWRGGDRVEGTAPWGGEGRRSGGERSRHATRRPRDAGGTAGPTCPLPTYRHATGCVGRRSSWVITRWAGLGIE